MVTRAYQVYVLLLEYVECVLPFRLRGIVQTVAFYAVAGIDEQEVGTISICLVSQMLREGDVVSPVSGEGRSTEV